MSTTLALKVGLECMPAGPELATIAKKAIFLIRTFSQLFDDNETHRMKPSTSQTKYDQMPVGMNTLHQQNGLTAKVMEIFPPPDRHSIEGRLTPTPGLFTFCLLGYHIGWHSTLKNHGIGLSRNCSFSDPSLRMLCLLRKRIEGRLAAAQLCKLQPWLNINICRIARFSHVADVELSSEKAFQGKLVISQAGKGTPAGRLE
jgi:hypothetical protein